MPQSQFADRISGVISSHPGAVAIEADGREVTWGEVHRIFTGIQRAMDDTGIAPDARVGLMARNLPPHFAALWAVFCSGRCVSMIHAFQPPAALAGDLRSNRWPIVFGERRDWSAEVVAAADSAGSVGFAFTADPDAPVERVTANAHPAADVPPGDGDTVLQLLSSGTTGTPKRISLTRKSVDDMIEQTIAQYELAGPAAGTPSIMPWPLSSLGGTNASLPAAALEQKLVIQERFDAETMLELIRRHKPAMLSLAPASFGMILQLDPPKDTFASVKMIHTGSAPLDPNVHARLEDEYGIPVLLMYGATEFAGIICGWGAEEMAFLGRKDKRGSVGRARQGMQLRVVSPETGETVPTGEYGLIQAIVPRIGPDWVTTTDVGRLDEDGFLYLQGRADDVIIRGGFKVLPDEVADVLRLHPKVGDAAVIGVKDERLGAVPGAVIERAASGELPSEAELLDYLRERLPSYKIPVRFAFVDSLPRTPTMKPQRQGLLDLLGAGARPLCVTVTQGNSGPARRDMGGKRQGKAKHGG